MKRVPVRFVVLATAGLSTACGADHHGGSPYMAQDISLTRAEVARHHEEVTLMTSIEQLPAEVQRHGMTMDNIMGQMNERMEGMGHCSGAGRATMMIMMGQMDIEMEMHRTALANAADLPTARVNCESHMESMGDMLDMMRNSLDGASCSGM